MNDVYYNVHDMNNNDREDSLTLEILETIENKSDVTQRHLADNLGVALGLTNSYLKRCVRKGFVKIKQVPANRYLYYLTPKGFAEKSRLTALYLSRSFDFYRNAGQSITSLFQECNKHDWHHLFLSGLSELAEIAYIRAQEYPVQIIGIWDPVSNQKLFLGLPVWHSVIEIPACDACVITGLEEIEAFHGELVKIMEPERILIPDILGSRPHYQK